MKSRTDGGKLLTSVGGGDRMPATDERTIARMTDPCAVPARLPEARGLIHGGPDPVARRQTDAFREIRTRLLAMIPERNFITLVVPVDRGSGASFVARNLAAAFALDETRTALLVDCNLRNPAQHQAFGIEPTTGGLVDYLEHPALGMQSVIYSTGAARLRLLPAGRSRHGEGEYFSSFRLRAALDSLKCRYIDRYLFLDGPAVTGAPDARILSELADLVVLVAGYGRDTPQAISQAAAVFDPAIFAGVVFNERP